MHLQRDEEAIGEEGYARELAVDPQCMPQVRPLFAQICEQVAVLPDRMMMMMTQLQSTEELQMRWRFHEEDSVPAVRLRIAAG